MSKKNYNYSVKCGASRRKVEALNLYLGEPSCLGDDDDWVIKCEVSGFFNETKDVQGRSAFDCLVCGMAYLRQTLRFIKAGNPKMKFYFEFDGQLDELTIEDIFMTHDCITDEMEEMIEWAQDNGYKPE
jgi:hypothetical protein